MKKTILAIIATTVIIFLLWATPVIANTTNSEAYIPSETTVIYEYVETSNKEELINLIKAYKEEQRIYQEMYKELSILNLEHSIVLQEAKEKLIITETYLSYYENKYNQIIKAEEEALWEQKTLEYPAATLIWRELKEYGYNDYVCAGILGNIMAEVGGQTLNINYAKYSSSSKGYYGICQWSKSYKEVWNTSLEQQIKYLYKTIIYEFDTYGFKYKKHFDYDDFYELTNEKEAALAFAKCYERCAKASYEQRQVNATKAYEYFVN